MVGGRTLQARKIETPTAVQAQAIPCISTGRDIVTLAATGSGKTLCYLLPLLARADQHRHIGSLVPVASAVAMPFALILVPTRELMDQVLHELLSFLVVPSPQTSSFEPVSAFGLCGGISVQMQTSWLRAHSMQLQVVVATPGRLLRMLELAVLSLNRLTFLVIDEVDRILETEMEHQVRQILTTHANTSLHRQTLLFSATLPHFMDRIVRSTVVDPITIRVGMGAQGTGTVASSSTAATLRELPLVSQDVVFLRFAEKKSRLLEVLRATPYPPVLVFCNSHESVDFVTRVLQREQFHVASLHGEHSQSYRFQVMSAFRAGAVDVLVATDLASRGLDFDTVDHVVIFDMPHTIEDYVHRCGRTGRRRESTTEGDRRATGKVTAFLTIECGIAADLKRVLEETRQPVPLELAVPSRFHSPPQ